MAECAGATGWRLERADEPVLDSGAVEGAPTVSLPLRQRRGTAGTLHLYVEGELDESALRIVRFAARCFARGLDYASRLAQEGGRRQAPDLGAALANSPLTPREQYIVELLVSGKSTRQIAADAGLTVSTVNTYLKRVFAKLGVHSRVELIARVAGTASGTP
ncbi:MAG: helix-turn-helix transcriptional regulator [Myxococcota bacterium]